MAAKVPRDYQLALRESRARLVRLAERRGVASLKPLFDRAITRIEHKLSRAASQIGEDSFSAHQLRMMLAQLRIGDVMLDLGPELADITREAQLEATRGLSQSISRLERQFRGAEVVLPLEEASVLQSLISARRPQLDEMHRKALSTWGQDAFEKVHRELSLSIAAGETGEEAIARVPQSLAAEWYRGERIVRTEVAFAYNATQADALVQAREVLPDLMMRWTEHCDDSGEANPLDDRVGEDSIALHGQVTPPGGWFTMPDDAPEVSESLVGRQWQFPPNRPNDRAVLAPWRPGWGVPAYQWTAGGRVAM